jgi:2-polyprenyl-3-methyl-5-hydroxy-6-metoxy-1,4-benzoquinol methylase
MLPNTGERQVHRELAQIKPNHRERYKFAKLRIQYEFEDRDRPIKVFDAACGIGYGTTILSHAHPGIYVGADIDNQTIEEANTYYRHQNIGPDSEVSYLQMNLDDESAWNDIDDIYGMFDAIVSIETIEHVADAEKLIAQFAAHTDMLIGSVPNEDVVPFNKESHPFHMRHYTKGEFETLLNDHGFFVDMWATQYDKIPGAVVMNDDGMGFIVKASKR